MAALRIAWVLLVAVAFLGAAGAVRADRLGLWHIVHDQCVVHFTASHHPAPCQAVRIDAGEASGYAVLKDLEGATQFLLIPTRRLTGIEDPALLAPGAANYFADAWREIGLVAARAHADLPREDLSLAINAVIGRSQDQLHIHMDCVRADVRDALRRLASGIGASWAPLGEAVGGHRYQAMRVDGAGLDAANPFRLLADGVPGAASEMGRHTLVVVGMIFGDGAPGFVLLDDRSDPLHADFGNGENLQDHACAVSQRP
jgi:CDP-diacylglycerol pyrophosphatase